LREDVLHDPKSSGPNPSDAAFPAGTPVFTLGDIQRVTVMQGQARVSSDPNVEFTTVLGSCVALCLFDPNVRLGGMNHFLLSEPPASHVPGEIDVHYGVYLMELLINEMLGRGAAKMGMRAHIYGGANLHLGMTPIGSANAHFARGFLERERIPVLREDLQGNRARRIDFRPASGQVRCRVVENQFAPANTPSGRPKRSCGDVELF
jgi:chemotaxis protein CheD